MPKPKRAKAATAEPEVQGSQTRSIAKTDQLKRIVKQHPVRDEPKVDAIDEIRYMNKTKK
jgi:hypothetical protein